MIITKIIFNRNQINIINTKAKTNKTIIIRNIKNNHSTKLHQVCNSY